MTKAEEQHLRQDLKQAQLEADQREADRQRWIDEEAQTQAEARAEDDFRTAEKKADERGLVDAQKWQFITGYLQKTLAIAYAS